MLGVSFLLRTCFLVLLASVLPAIAQDKPASDTSKSPAPPLTPAARLAAAKTALLKKTGSGNNVAYDVISSTLEGWGRFQLVKDPEKADVIIEIYSVDESGGGISASAGDGGRGRGRSVTVVAALMRLTVYDAKNHVPLWTATEHPKGAMKKVDRENKEVEAAQALIVKFHDYVEPSAK